jgi:hypothetical protein
VIDIAVYRGRDMLSSWLVAASRSLGLGLPVLSFAALPLALAWLATSIGLGRRYEAARGRA